MKKNRFSILSSKDNDKCLDIRETEDVSRVFLSI